MRTLYLPNTDGPNLTFLSTAAFETLFIEILSCSKKNMFTFPGIIVCFVFFKAASEKREGMEKKLRAKLEEELSEYRSLQKRRLSAAGGIEAFPQGSMEQLDELRRKFSEAEERVRTIEALAMNSRDPGFKPWQSQH